MVKRIDEGGALGASTASWTDLCDEGEDVNLDEGHLNQTLWSEVGVARQTGTWIVTEMVPY